MDLHIRSTNVAWISWRDEKIGRFSIDMITTRILSIPCRFHSNFNCISTLLVIFIYSLSITVSLKLSISAITSPFTDIFILKIFISSISAWSIRFQEWAISAINSHHPILNWSEEFIVIFADSIIYFINSRF